MDSCFLQNGKNVPPRHDCRYGFTYAISIIIFGGVPTKPCFPDEAGSPLPNRPFFSLITFDVTNVLRSYIFLHKYMVSVVGPLTEFDRAIGYPQTANRECVHFAQQRRTSGKFHIHSYQAYDDALYDITDMDHS
jgi:hypothetical protein